MFCPPCILVRLISVPLAGKEENDIAAIYVLLERVVAETAAALGDVDHLIFIKRPALRVIKMVTEWMLHWRVVAVRLYLGKTAPCCV